MASAARPTGRLAWLHGASVGESLSLLPLADRLLAELPGIAVLVTSGTRASGEVLAQRLPAGVIHQYLPVDTPAAVAAFLGHWRPDLGVIVESELWPNLILATKESGARLALLSARLSLGSERGWAWFGGALREMLQAFDLVLARDADAAAAFARLGVTVDGVADLKLGAAPLPFDDNELARMREATRGRPVILAASTHAGEEGVILDAFLAVRGDPRRPLLIIAPRHVGRGEAIAVIARELGLEARLRSMGEDVEGAETYIADTLGEMGLWFRLAGLGVLGGSFVTGLGGHNPLEPARLGCPAVSGPHVENWPISLDLQRVGAARLVRAGEELEAVLRAGLQPAAWLTDMAARAGAFVEARDAEAEAALSRVVALLAA